MKDKLAFLTPDERILLMYDMTIQGLFAAMSSLTGVDSNKIAIDVAKIVANKINKSSEDEIKAKIEKIRASAQKGLETGIKDFKASNN